MDYHRAVCWIRRDIRLSDHRALAEATANARQVALAFVFDTTILDALEDRDDRRVNFIYDSLKELDDNLKKHGSKLVVLHGNPIVEIPKLCRDLDAEALFFNEDVDPYAVKRDAEVVRQVKHTHSFKDHVVFIRDEILNLQGEPFKVFTPYSKAWKARLKPEDVASYDPDLKNLWPAKDLPAEFPTLEHLGFERNSLWLEPGESGAQQRLREFLPKLPHYAENRDCFDIDGTSGLSVHLRHGTISIRECFRAAEGYEKWFNELIWREFYHMILSQFPHVVEGAFRPEYNDIIWPGDDHAFEKWASGQTGYPIVDAAMRCFNATGWMHNRLRMVVAMFLTKDLLVDWRKGEAYFARYLLDFDLAQNNGGWQWSASTGVDAQPYFRIFNPYLQSVKFDPDASFITKWCPELTDFPVEFRHWPHEATQFDQEAARCILGQDYPHPIVDHQEQKSKAIALFKVAT
ncbi:MAG: deoxyribodipyrimidine photo-lyase [Chthonomonas sp.]|nr:deoxyribodipyrimidine photo-lyase [Chthonomonas sp.]